MAFRCKCGKEYSHRAELSKHILDMAIWRDQNGKHGRGPFTLTCGCVSDASFICEEHHASVQPRR